MKEKYGQTDRQREAQRKVEAVSGRTGTPSSTGKKGRITSLPQSPCRSSCCYERNSCHFLGVTSLYSLGMCSCQWATEWQKNKLPASYSGEAVTVLTYKTEPKQDPGAGNLWCIVWSNNQTRTGRIKETLAVPLNVNKTRRNNNTGQDTNEDSSQMTLPTHITTCLANTAALKVDSLTKSQTMFPWPRWYIADTIVRKCT